MIIQGISAPAISPEVVGTGQRAAKGPTTFLNFLSDAVNELNQAQGQADELVSRLVTNAPVDLHDVVIATEKADIALQLVLQVRNKLVEAYQEIMRTQV